MKLTKFGNLLLIGLTLCFVTGCKKKPVGVTNIPGRTGNPGDLGTNPMLTPEGGLGETPGGGIPQPAPGQYSKRDEEMFKANTVHFAYDSTVVRNDEKSKVAAVADYLKANSANGLEIQGHCDERGTDQYNMSLGERRALALREELIRMGVDGSKVMTVTFGRTRPADTGHSDEAHARNRRGEFVLLSN